MAKSEYDYIIIGTGAGAGPLILRLSENRNTRLLVLEAGPDLKEPSDRRRDFTQFLWDEYAFHDWKFRTEKTSSGVPSMFYPQGRLTGGSTHYIAGYFVRATREDHDEWDSLLGGNSGWGFDECLPYYLMIENDPQFGNRPYHSSKGPVKLYRVPPELWKPYDVAFAEAAKNALKLDEIHDHNDPDVGPRTGIGPAVAARALEMEDGSIRGCRQCGFGGVLPCKYDAKQSTLVTYIAQVRERDRRENVKFQGQALVKRILFAGNRQAIGVEYLDRDDRERQERAGQVILCAGAIGSPAILLRSGIGPAAALRHLGIAVVQDLPGVGRNFMDHPAMFLGYRLREDVAPHIGFETFLYAKFRSTVSRSFAFDEGWNIQIVPGHTTQLNLFPLLAGASRFGLQSKRSTRDLWRKVAGILVANYKPRSTGNVCLRSTRPDEDPIIQPGYYTNPEAHDLEIIYEGFKAAEQVFHTPPLDKLVEGPIAAPKTLEEVPRFTGTNSHPAGTCKMGKDGDRLAVCDRRGRVRGIANLRVADASLMPTIPRANIYCPTLMIGERVSSFILDGTP